MKYDHEFCFHVLLFSLGLYFPLLWFVQLFMQYKDIGFEHHQTDVAAGISYGKNWRKLGAVCAVLRVVYVILFGI